MALGSPSAAWRRPQPQRRAEVDFSDKVDRRNITLDAVRHAIETEDKAALMDSLIVCKFLRGVFEDFYGEAA